MAVNVTWDQGSPLHAWHCRLQDTGIKCSACCCLAALGHAYRGWAPEYAVYAQNRVLCWMHQAMKDEIMFDL